MKQSKGKTKNIKVKYPWVFCPLIPVYNFIFVEFTVKK